MNIKNYTSTVPVERTIARIESRLAQAGVSGTQRQYGPTGQIASFVFTVALDGKRYDIRIPVNVDNCFEVMANEHRKTHPRMRTETQTSIREQAYRTAWRLVEDWIAVQISFVVMRQAEWLQVFLPYIWNGASQTTVYDRLKGNGFKALPENGV